VDLFRPDAAECRVREALDAIAQGRPVVVVDDAATAERSDLIFAASRATRLS
jgi:3,4-dihydroxy 2-butanone 4-phosphate synthase/GTP cyclohydrolase II